MLDTIKIPKVLQDLIKVVVGIKVVLFICLNAEVASFLFKNSPKHAEPDPVTLEIWQFFINSSSYKIFLTTGNFEITIFSKEFFSCLKVPINFLADFLL